MQHDITRTIGVDLGDRHSAYCVLDQDSGLEVGQGCLRTTPEAFEAFFQLHPDARVWWRRAPTRPGCIGH